MDYDLFPVSDKGEVFYDYPKDAYESNPASDGYMEPVDAGHKNNKPSHQYPVPYNEYMNDRTYGEPTYTSDTDFGTAGYVKNKGSYGSGYPANYGYGGTGFMSDQGYGGSGYVNDQAYGSSGYMNDQGYGASGYMNDQGYGYSNEQQYKGFGDLENNDVLYNENKNEPEIEEVIPTMQAMSNKEYLRKLIGLPGESNWGSAAVVYASNSSYDEYILHHTFKYLIYSACS